MITDNDTRYWRTVRFVAAWFLVLVIWAALLASIVCYESPPKIGETIAIYVALVTIIPAIAICTLRGLCGPTPEVQRDRQIFLFCGCFIAVVSTAFCGVFQHRARSCKSLEAVVSSAPSSLMTPVPTAAPNTVLPGTWLDVCVFVRCESMVGTTEPQDATDPSQIVVAALESFYDEANGFNWLIDTNWKTTMDVCDWYGIVCENGKVVELNLDDNNIYGSISSSIGLLTDLVNINLESNYLSGKIPTEIGNLSNLRRFEVDDNNLTGSIPSEFYRIKDLKELYLQLNDFSGTVPEQLCLRRIDMGGELDTLIADCEGNGNSFGNDDIVCSCCSMCF